MADQKSFLFPDKDRDLIWSDTPSHPHVNNTSGARNSDPITSHQASAIAQVNAETNRALALQLLNDAHPDGLTDFELASLSGVQQTSIGKRRGELRDAGFVEDSGHTRPSPSGTQAIVWRIKDEYATKKHATHCVTLQDPTKTKE